MAEIAVQGLSELSALLKSLPVRVEANILRGAVRAGQKVVLQGAQARVPVDQGDLRKSIRVRTDMRAQRRGYVRADVVAGNATAWYAGLIEFGTGPFYSGPGSTSKRAPYQIKPVRREGALYFGGTIRKAVTHPGIHPQPYMRPAAQLLDGPALDAFVAYVRTRLPKELAKAGK